MTRVPTEVELYIELGGPNRVWEFKFPADWFLHSIEGKTLAFFELPRGLKVGVNAFIHAEQVWLHASISARDRIPDYADLVHLKNVVFGTNGYASQSFVPEPLHVNIHPYCLHLWGPRNPHDWPLPVFGHEGTI